MNFRAWCQEKWYEHCDEILSWSGHNVKYLSSDYFGKYKWWLKRQYRAEVRQD